MKNSVIFILIVSTIAAGESAKSIEKRGTLSSSYRSQYLPPTVPSTNGFTGGVPSSPTYGVPAFAPAPSLTVPSRTYAVPAPVSSSPTTGQSVAAISATIPAPAFGVPSLPSSTYGVPLSVASSPSYVLPPASASSFVPQPALVGSSATLGNGVASSVSLSNVPSDSYRASSPIAGSLPSNGGVQSLSLPSVGYANGNGASLGQFSLPSKSYGVPSTTFGVGSGISSTLVASQGDGYSYPVPSTKLII